MTFFFARGSRASSSSATAAAPLVPAPSPALAPAPGADGAALPALPLLLRLRVERDLAGAESVGASGSGSGSGLGLIFMPRFRNDVVLTGGGGLGDSDDAWPLSVGWTCVDGGPLAHRSANSGVCVQVRGAHA